MIDIDGQLGCIFFCHCYPLNNSVLYLTNPIRITVHFRPPIIFSFHQLHFSVVAQGIPLILVYLNNRRRQPQNGPLIYDSIHIGEADCDSYQVAWLHLDLILAVRREDFALVIASLESIVIVAWTLDVKPRDAFGRNAARLQDIYTILAVISLPTSY